MADQHNTNGLLARLQQGVLVGDGAMATVLHQTGLPMRTCFEELNLVRPDLVRDVHRAYAAAGASVVQTNTFSAHRIGLARYGLADKVETINQTAVQLARTAVPDHVLVLGSVGGTVDITSPGGIDAGPQNVLTDVFQEQIGALVAAGVDGILLETFATLQELLVAVETAKSMRPIPVLAHLSPDAVGVTRDGVPLAAAFQQLRAAGADVVGLNCRLGPSGILRSYEAIPLEPGALYSAAPNAGLLHLVEDDVAYTGQPDYFAEMGQALVKLGVRFVGGCCGTTPDHIRALAKRLSGAAHDAMPSQPAEISARPTLAVSAQPSIPVPSSGPPTLAERARRETVVIVELDPPKSLDVSRYLEGAMALHQAGADAITLADNSLGQVRVSNMALASMLKSMGIEPLVHVTCRDRNLIGQQSHLMGLNVLDIHHILLVTGDPSRFGDLPGATSVYDVSSIELTKLVKRLNTGVAFSGQPMKVPARFSVGTSFNPNVLHFDKALDRLRRKLDAGADYVLTQPMFDPRMFERIARAAASFDVPVFAGVMPLTSARNAQFLHNEVPGIVIPEDVLQRITAAPAESAASVGLELAQDLLREAMLHFNGIYLVTPFLRYDLSLALTRFIHEHKPAAVTAGKVAEQG